MNKKIQCKTVSELSSFLADIPPQAEVQAAICVEDWHYDDEFGACFVEQDKSGVIKIGSLNQSDEDDEDDEDNHDDADWYPALTDQGKIEAQRIMDRFKKRFVEIADEELQNLYCDVSFYAESDSWANFRISILDGLKAYGENKHRDNQYFKDLRRAIYAHNKKEIIKDLNQDLVEENARLKTMIDELVARDE